MQLYFNAHLTAPVQPEACPPDPLLGAPTDPAPGAPSTPSTPGTRGRPRVYASIPGESPAERRNRLARERKLRAAALPQDADALCPAEAAALRDAIAAHAAAATEVERATLALAAALEAARCG